MDILETNNHNGGDTKDRRQHFERPTTSRPQSLISISLLTIILGIISGLGGYLVGKTWLPADFNFLNVQPDIKITLEQPLVDIATKNLKSVAGIYRPVKVNALSGKPVLGANDLLGQAAVVTSDGWLMTSDQVAVDRQSLIALDNSIYNIKEIRSDKFAGLIFMKIEANGLVPVNFQFADVFKKGELVFTAVDVPYNIDHKLLTDVLSHVHYALDNNLSTDAIDYYLLLEQGDYSIGSPYFNAKGDLLGLSHKVGAQPVLIPVEYLRQAVRHLLDNTQRVAWGINYLDIENNIGLVAHGNVVTVSPVRGSIAAKADVRAGDRIVAINNDTVSKDRTITSILQNYRAGDKVILKVLRSDVEMDIELK